MHYAILLLMRKQELARQANERADGDSDDEGFRDLDEHPMSDQRLLAPARRIQEETGVQIVFERPAG